MVKIHHDRYLRALLGQEVDRTPIWMMRQAGRYLPEYRQLRAEAGSFMNLCKDPQLACEVTLQPLRRFDVDAAIIFSDILTIPDAMGLGLSFKTGEGPCFANSLRSMQDIRNLPIPDPTVDLRYVLDAIELTRKTLQGEVPLIGFSGSPWTLATYMIEGGSSKTFSKIRRMLYTDPVELHTLLDKLAKSVILYLNAQIEAGAQSLMIFDTWGGMLSYDGYRQFSLNYMAQIVDGLDRGNRYQDKMGNYVPVTLFTKGGGLWLDSIAKTGCDAIGVDWTVNLHEARRIIEGLKIPVALQGNLDPAVLYGSKDVIYKQVASVLDQYGKGAGHIFNLGHGIMQDTPIEHVNYLIKAVQEISARYYNQ